MKTIAASPYARTASLCADHRNHPHTYGRGFKALARLLLTTLLLGVTIVSAKTGNLANSTILQADDSRIRVSGASPLSLSLNNDLAPFFLANGKGVVFQLGSAQSYVYSVPSGYFIQASDGNFYGTTGAYITKAASDGSAGTTLNSTAFLNCNFIIEGSDGYLYGTADGSYAPTYNSMIFRMSKTGAMSTVYTFNASTQGHQIVGLIEGSDGNLYGTLLYGPGGGGNTGVLFQVTKSGGGYRTLLTGLQTYSNNEYFYGQGGPSRGGVIEASDGYLYGVNQVGNGTGSVFRVGKNGSGYSVVATMSAMPYSVMEASDGNLYGVTANGQTLFRLTKAGVYTALYTSWSLSFNIVQASNGKIYGVEAGSGNYGIFCVTTDGTYTPIAANLPYAGNASPFVGLNLNLAAGDPLSLSIGSTVGPGPISVQWLKNGSVVGTGITYSVANALPANAGTYTYLLTNSFGTNLSLETSSTFDQAIVTVSPPTAPSITTQPASLNPTLGTAASISVVATGTPTLIYQWAKSPHGANTWTNIAGATTATLSFAAVQSSDSVDYHVTVTNSYGLLTSSIAFVNVQQGQPPQFTTQPQAASGFYGDTITFSVSAYSPQGSTDPVSYQWYKGSTAITGNASATTDTLTLTNVQASDATYSYYVKATNFSGSNPSSTVSLTLGTQQPPTITSNPANVTVTAANQNRTFHFSVTATGVGTLSYQWQVKPNNVSPWSNVQDNALYSGSNTSTLSLKGSFLDNTSNGAFYQCIVTADTGQPGAISAPSGSAILYVSGIPPLPPREGSDVPAMPPWALVGLAVVLLVVGCKFMPAAFSRT